VDAKTKAIDWTSYHAGELEVQTRAGVYAGDAGAEEMYRSAMPSGVQRFLTAQQLAVVATMASNGRVWASLRSGPPGFLRVIDDSTLEIGGDAHPDDPLLSNVAAHAVAGVLAIQLAARQRVRVNGAAWPADGGRILLRTRQVYGNCQQYIQARKVAGAIEAPAQVSPADRPKPGAIRDWVEGADTFFIATGHPDLGMDASHRGGRPGFVRMETDTRMVFPDYSGNNMFNSLGNITAYPPIGLLFPDFRSGAALQLSGVARIVWPDSANISRIARFPGARRLVEFDIERAIELPQATRLRFQFDSYSPFLPKSQT